MTTESKTVLRVLIRCPSGRLAVSLILLRAGDVGPQRERAARAVRVVRGARDLLAGRQPLLGLGETGRDVVEIAQDRPRDHQVGDAGHQSPTAPVRLISVSSIWSIVVIARALAW